MDSNYTLRFNRSAREAYGHDVQFSDADKWDRRVLLVAIFCGSFVVGLMVGGVV